MTSKPASKPLSLRLTHEERARLEDQAGNLSLSAYVRLRLFGVGTAKRKVRGRHTIKDHVALGRVLGLLGASGISSSLIKLAKAVELDALPVTPETEAAIKSACRDIRAMHAALMRALGFRSSDKS